MQMEKTSRRNTLLWILLTEGVGALAAALTREGTRQYAAWAEKPPLSPPPVVFVVVWIALYALMGVSAARIASRPPSQERGTALRLYLLQLGVNFLWSILFFNLRAYRFAFFWLVLLWALIVRMALSFRELDRIAAHLQLPYLLWVLFAGYLNYGVWMLNR